MVGSRDGALAAAERLGLDVLLLDDTRPSARRRSRIARFGRVDLERPDGLSEAGHHARLARRARALATDMSVVAVVGMTERAVVPAAVVREALGQPGLGIGAARACHDKAEMKRAVHAAGLPHARWASIGSAARADALIDRLGLPLVIKQRASSGARGARICAQAAEVRDALRPGWIAESFVPGAEMSVESFVIDGRVVFANPTEYLVPFWANLLPARLPAVDAAAVLDLNQRAITALGITRGLTHLELFLGPDGPVFGEIAVRPPGGHLMDLLELAYGFDPWETLLCIEQEERPSLPDGARRSAGVYVLHPGAGVVRSVRGLSAARAVPGIVTLRCRARSGNVLRPRVGSGQTVGHLVAVGPDRDAVASAMVVARAHIRIRVEETEQPPGRYGTAGSKMLAPKATPEPARRQSPTPRTRSARTRRPE